MTNAMHVLLMSQNTLSDLLLKQSRTQQLTRFSDFFLKSELPDFAVGDERVSICMWVSTKRVGGPQISRTAWPALVAGFAAFLLSCHTFQKAEFLLFFFPLWPVPQLPILPLKWVVVAWERGILLWQGVTDISERVTVCLAILVPWHLALGTPVRACTPWKRNKSTISTDVTQLYTNNSYK